MSISPRTKFCLLLLFTMLPGVAGVFLFGYYALVDWTALQATYHHYEQVAASSSDLRAVVIADADQNIHRLNLFADGVWTLLSAILGAVGLHGICSERSGRTP